MPPRLPAAAALAVLALLLAGCVAITPTGPPVSARGIGPGAPSADGGGGFALTVRVLAEPGGPPLEGAGVVVYWSQDDPASWGRGSVDVQAGPGGARVEADGVAVAVPGSSPATPRAQSVLRLRTDAAGEALARVPANRVVGVVAAAEGWTEEWIPALASGSDRGADATPLPLYRANVPLAMEGAWGPGGASTGVVTSSNYLWRPEPAPIGSSPEAARGYAARLAGLRLELRWANGLDGVGDLALGAGPTEGEPTVLEDASTDAAPGEHVEAFDLDLEAVREAGLRGAAALLVGPASRSAYVAPLGLPHALEGEARFETAVQPAGWSFDGAGGGGAGASVPGPAAPLAALALLGAALALRRRAA